MAQVINEYRGLGDVLGQGLGQGVAGLGQGIGNTLQNLASVKLNQLAQRQQAQQVANAFQQIPGITPEVANFLSVLSPEERKYPLQNLGSLMQLGQALGSQAAQHVVPSESGVSALQGLTAADLLSKGNQVNPLLQQALRGAPLQQQGQPQGAQPLYPQAQATAQPKAQDQAKLIEDIFTSPQEKRERHKLALKERQMAAQEKHASLKETKQYVDTLKNQEKAAKESDLRLNRMVKLIEKGKLPNAGLWSFLTKIEEAPIAGAGAGAILGSALIPGVGTAVGAGLGGLAGALTSPLAGAAKSFIRSGSPDIEEFEKLSADFVKNAKQFFGPRLTDADLRVFMQTLPTLMQTDAGKKKVIENLRSINELAEIEAKAARTVIRENGGIPPIDIEQQVKDRISDEIDAVAKRFIGK